MTTRDLTKLTDNQLHNLIAATTDEALKYAAIAELERRW